MEPKDCQFSERCSQTGVQVFEVQNGALQIFSPDKNVSENLLNNVYLCELLCVGQIVDSDGQEDVEQRVCDGVKETPTECDGLSGGSDEKVEGGDEAVCENHWDVSFPSGKESFQRSNCAGYSCQKV